VFKHRRPAESPTAQRKVPHRFRISRAGFAAHTPGSELQATTRILRTADTCGGEEFEITVGLHLYDGSDDVKWLYLGCRCPSCGLTATYGDWQNEFIDYRKLLARV
jgi:hypothetical protein